MTAVASSTAPLAACSAAGAAASEPASAPRAPAGPLSDAEATELLRQAVATPSLTGKEREVAKVLQRWMATSADEAFIDAAGNAVGVWGSGERLVTFVGHMDTVPGDIEVRIEDGVLHGRGAVDAKGSLCTAIAAASRLSHETRSQLTLMVVGAVEEEGPSSKGARFAAANYPRPDHLIIGEPSGWEAYTLGYKGRISLKLNAARDGGHSSREQPTAAACVVSGYNRLATFVAADNLETSGIFERLQLSLDGLESSDDGLVQRAVAVISLRLPPRWRCGDLVARLLALLEAEPLTLEVTAAEEAHRADERSELARVFRVAIRQQAGRPRPKLKAGTSDMNVLAPLWPVPMLAYGPGDAALDHTPQERLELREYLLAIEVLNTALEALA